MSAPSPLPPRSWFDTEDAPPRAELNTCIHCGLCLTACPTYRELKIEPDSPRGRIYLMRGLAEGRIQPSDPLVTHLDNCLDCRACETVCPAGVPYSRMLEATRGQLNRRVLRGTAPRLLGEWVLRQIMPYRERLHFVVDLLQFGQGWPFSALMRSSAADVLPEFARQGYAMTPPLVAREQRALERVKQALPPGARMERRGRDLVFLPAGTPRARVGFFTTCVMETMFPAVNHAAVRLLVLAGAEVRVPAAQTCCGALHAHAGLRREAKALARANVAAFETERDDFIITDSAGCGAALRDCGHLLHDDARAVAAEQFSAKVRDVSEVLDELGLPAPAQPLASTLEPSRPLRIAYHDPCHLAHAQKVRSAPRRLLQRLPGVEFVELPNSDWCCGSAGIYNLTHPDMANAQLGHKLDAIASVDPELVVASNPGCLLHMARGAAARGSRTRVVHLLDVLERAYPAGRA